IRPFIDRLIAAGALPEPQSEYTITWPSLFETSDKEKAQVATLKMRALALYTGKMGVDFPQNSAIVTPEEVRDMLNLRSKKIENTIKKTGGQAEVPGNDAPKPTANKLKPHVTPDEMKQAVKKLQ